MPNKRFNIPPSFMLPAMMKETELSLDPGEDPLKTIGKYPLIFDMLAENEGTAPYEPWNHGREPIEHLFKAWSAAKEEQERRFQNKRGKADLALMGYSYSAFIACIHWINGQHAPSVSSSIGPLTRKPVNVEDRLSYIMNNPLQFHSFIQLKQLFEELEKMHHKQMALLKIKEEKSRLQ
ncbi:hypothetical protein CEF21_13870 [Bacillus sp. FJAT-42376]|uniref:YpoC family protein n=1 Tax=Bacillus sp. FJAT-42376 TaxID=2014076 RepID=UPI000F505199|nr:hypothetical protein [Bacillus sp. FJAT-42376]AZB43301.1 hypothetical protein CEF21_13870 [Bacillus sp. FJAT-42376]